MSRPRKYPLHAVLDLYATGISQAEVGRQLGLHHTTVAYALRAAGIEPRMRLPLMRHKREKQRAIAVVTARRRIEVVRLYVEEKLSTPQIAARLHLGLTTVYEHLRAGGISFMRPKGVRVRKDIRLPNRYYPPEPVSKVERLLALAARKKGCAA